LKNAVQALPQNVGIEMVDWNWKTVRAFIQAQFGLLMSRSSCLNYLHRLGFVLKRPKKRLLKADAEKRKAFVALYAALRVEAEKLGALIFFADEALFRADADLRGKWVLKGQPALVDSTSPKRSEKVCYYSAVCLETGDVETMEVVDTCTSETSAAFLAKLRSSHKEPLIVIWDNAPAHRGDAIRTFLSTPDLNMRLVALPSYSPDYNADEAIWGWIREEVTRNTCFGTKAKVREKVEAFIAALSGRAEETKQRCRTALQAQADALGLATAGTPSQSGHVDSTLALV
jgi:transposase